MTSVSSTTPDKAVASVVAMRQSFQTAYNFLAQNKMCKLYRTEDGQWMCVAMQHPPVNKCELIGEEK